MRTIELIGLVGLIGFAAAGQEGPREIRVVNGRSVDLASVQQWLAMSPRQRNDTPRPMAHWKAMKVGEITKQIGPWDLCVVTNEAGQAVTILLANLDAEVRGPIVRMGQIRGRMAELRNGINGAQASAASYGQSQAVALQRMSAMANNSAAAMQAELNKLKEEEGGLSQAYVEARRRQVLAMNTTGIYGGYQIWECGTRPAGGARGL